MAAVGGPKLEPNSSISWCAQIGIIIPRINMMTNLILWLSILISGYPQGRGDETTAKHAKRVSGQGDSCVFDGIILCRWVNRLEQ
jgi:hypothetical protein